MLDSVQEGCQLGTEVIDRMLMRRTILGLCAITALAGSMLTAPPSVGAADPPAYEIHTVGAYGGEPTIWSDSRGYLYSTYLHGNPNIFRSIDHGTTWTALKTADPSTGDDCIVSDQADNLYWCNLAGSPDIHPLEGDVWKSVDGGENWQFGEGNVPSLGGFSPLGTSSNVFGVDRQWVDTYIPPGGTTETATAYFFYHDFSAQSHVYVNVSHNGGANWDAPINLMTSFDPSAPDYLAVQTASSCSTIPAAVRTVKNGPHKGRVYAAWIASDATSFGSGCNLSQLQAFHTLIVAWSDNDGVTWTPKIAYDAGFFHDASSPFASFTLDDQGNPYYAFVLNKDWTAACAVPNNPQTAGCEFDMFVIWSPDGGDTWKGPFKANTTTGTHWFPAIAAGQPGQVDVAWLRTPFVIATDPWGKQHPGGCYPLQCGTDVQWNLWAAQSLNLDSASPTWTTTQVTSQPMHARDICNLGIACPTPVGCIPDTVCSNRHLADFISEALDENGCAHINYANDFKVAFPDATDSNQVNTADQVSGTCLGRTVPFVEPPPTATDTGFGIPNTTAGTTATLPVALLLLGGGIIAAGFADALFRRRRRGSARA